MVLGVVVVLALAATWASQRVPTGLLTLADLGWLLPFLAAGYYGCRISLGAARLPTLAKAGIALLAPLLLWLAAGTGPVLSLTAGNGVAGQLLSHSIRYALAAAGIATVWQLLRLCPPWASQALAGLGTATLGIYALNSPVLTAVRLWFPNWSAAAGPALTVLVVLVVAAAVLGVEWLITLVLGRIAVTSRVLLGRWPSRSATGQV